MTETDILAKLTQLFRDIFDEESLVITPQTTADDVEGWDSVNHITLVVAVEQAFKVKFKTAEIESLKDVGDLVKLVMAKTAA